MRTLITSTLAATTIAGAVAPTIASAQADLAVDRNTMLFRYLAPGVDSGAIQVIPDNLHNPIVLPCDVQSFGGQMDLDYLGAGPTVFPKVTATYFDAQNQQIASGGCLADHVFTEVVGTFHAMSAGTIQQDGFTMVSSTNQFCNWLYQPSDLPADAVVRIHLQLTAYPDDTYQGSLVPDPDLSNNGRDVYVRRACSCQ
ncbi:MAG TPA: hypothetical protein VFT22_34850 [Kofleriaceae bacterium]|nr:hypothetical protein [Kofleriaceae bacterium]